MKSKQLHLLLVGLLALISIPMSACGADQTAPAQEKPAQKEEIAKQPSTQDLKDMIAKEEAILVDVRTGTEYKNGHAKGAINIPLSVISKRLSELSKDKTIITVCRSGRRSQMATDILVEYGYKAFNGGPWTNFE